MSITKELPRSCRSCSQFRTLSSDRLCQDCQAEFIKDRDDAIKVIREQIRPRIAATEPHAPKRPE